MVTQEAYRRYKDKKTKPTEKSEDKKEQKIHAILDEIARMRGYEEKLVGKRKISPILQYVDDILDKRYGFKPIKRGESYYSRRSQTHPSGEEKVAEDNISPIEQYIALLGEQKIKEYESEYRYDKWVAEKEGFKSLGDRERSKAAALNFSSVGEYHEALAKEMKFETYEEYKKYLDGMWIIKNTYNQLIPQKDFDEVFERIEKRWKKEHEKFIMFCGELWKDSLRPYFEKTGKDSALVLVSDVQTELDKFHHSRPGSMNIYNIDDIAIGLSYCLEERGVNTILSKDSKTITFRKAEE